MQQLAFKFKWLNDQGQPTGFLSKKASFEDGTLRLDDVEIPAAAIVDVDFRTNLMVLSIAQKDGEPATVAFQVTSGKPEKIRTVLGQARSDAWAEMHRQELEAKGEGHLFRCVNCPNCDSTIDLTGRDETDQVSCEFCSTLSTLSERRKGESSFRLCDECGMYSHPRQFTIFYFYFLLVVYGWRSRQTWRCPGCMRGEAWKMLFGNLLFVLGVPVALVQLFRAYGGADIGGLYSGLDKANLQAKKGDLQGAIRAYRSILEKYPVAAGVKYNAGLAFVHQNDFDGASRMFQSALRDCANYLPAVRALCVCYENLGRTEDLKALKQLWGADDDDSASEQDA